MDLNALRSLLKDKDPAHFSYVLQIDISEYLEGDYHFVEKTCFCHVSLDQAKYLICQSGLSIEAVVISPNHRFSAIEELRYETKNRAIPFILFSLKFEQRVKDMAIELKADDYQWGALKLNLDYIQFLKRLKRFRFCSPRAMEKRMVVKTSLFKRSLDILVSLFILLLLSPAMVVIALIIKGGSRGPLLSYFQHAGHSYRIFDAYEFRTQADPHDSQWSARFGEVLRESGLSKLPQLFNVLKGDISLVGEKPLTLTEAAKLTTDKVAIRLLATPGLTGLWGVGKQKEVKFQPSRESLSQNSI